MGWDRGMSTIRLQAQGSKPKGLSLRFAWPSAAGVASSVCWRLSSPSPLQSTKNLPALPIPLCPSYLPAIAGAMLELMETDPCMLASEEGRCECE